MLGKLSVAYLVVNSLKNKLMCLKTKAASSGLVLLVPSNFSSNPQPAVSMNRRGESFSKSNELATDSWAFSLSS